MSEEKKSNTSKIIIALLVLLLAGAGAMYFLKDAELKDAEIRLKDAKTELIIQIDDLKIDLETQIKLLNEKIAENEELNEDLIAQRNELEETLKALRSSQVSVETLMIYKNKYYNLKTKIEELMVENEMLQMANKFLVEEKGVVSGKLKVQRVMAAKNKKIILAASEIAIVGLEGLGLKERNSGKQILTSKANKANKVKICFSLAPNVIAKKGNKELYIQVIAPGNQVIGNNLEANFNNESLKYSIKSKFNYNNEALDICEYIAEPKDGFAKGTYFINVFSTNKRIASSSFALK